MHLSASDVERIGKMPMNFIAGKERSGTSLLQLMLNAHPNIVAPPESHFIVLLYPRYGKLRQWTERDIKNFCDDLYKEGLFRNQWKLNKETVLNSLLPLSRHLTYPIVCKMIYYFFAPEGKDVRLFFDKNPVYYYFLPQLEKMFLEARFIHIVRDYHSNIVSHKRVFRLKRAADVAYRWVKVNELIEEGKKRIPNKYFTLKYEDLVTAPEAKMKEICSFLDISFSENMSNYQEGLLYPGLKEKDKLSKRFLDIHGSLLQPISNKYVDDWKEKLSTDEVAEAEAVAGKLYGYETYAQKPVKIGVLQLAITKFKYSLLKNAYASVFKWPWLYPLLKHKLF